MSPEELLIDYVWPEPGTFWRWSDDCAVCWWDGSTLALYPEIEAVLERLLPHGLPRFEEMLLVLSACRKNWSEPGGGAQRLDAWIDSYDDSAWGGMSIEHSRQMLRRQLDAVHEIAEKAAFAPQAAANVLEAVFSARDPHLSQEDGKQVVGMFQSDEAALEIHQRTLLLGVGTSSMGQFETIRNVIAAISDAPGQDAEFSEKTGLPTELSPAKIDDLPFVERVRALVEALQEDDKNAELAGLARIAQTLSAVVRLPRPVSEPEELPLGGYSDIANRGNLDRLLVSELALDADVLAVRVALNEALYLRRESPPRQPARRRAIFIDVGIRLWGLPRVFAHSLALAFAMQCERDAEVTVQTRGEPDPDADGELPIVPLTDAKLDSREGLMDLLGRLTPEHQPGEAVRGFLAQSQDSRALAEAADCIVITHPAAADDPEFRHALRQIPGAEFFLATVDAQGNYRLAAHNPAGRRELQQARLDLESLLSGGSKSLSADLLRHRDASLPKILRQREFPLFLAPSLELANTVFHPETGLVGYTKTGLLYHWPDAGQGAKLLTDSLPGGVISWREIDPDERIARLLIPRADRTATLITANLENGETTQMQLKHGLEFVRHTCRVDDLLVFAGDRSLVAHRLSDGHKSATLECERCRRGCGRFVRLGYEWYAINAGIIRLTLTPAPELSGLTTELVWEAANWPAPIAMTTDLAAYCLLDPAQLVSRPGAARFVSLRGMSWDGERLIVSATPRGANVVESRYFVDLNRGEVESASATDQRLEPGAANILRRGQNVRNRYSAVGVSPGGVLLVRSGAREFVMSSPAGVPRLQWDQSAERRAQVADRVFWEELEAAVPPAGTRFRLQKAAWPDGSAAYLDARGLLHLKSSDTTVPEVTLVMKEGMISAWATSGEYTGNAYFIGANAPRPPECILAHIVRFAAIAAKSC